MGKARFLHWKRYILLYIALNIFMKNRRWFVRRERLFATYFVAAVAAVYLAVAEGIHGETLGVIGAVDILHAYYFTKFKPFI